MAWNYDDGRNVYRASDGSTFTTEKAAQEYQDKKDGRTAESDRIAREYAEAMGKIIAQAWDLINKGQCNAAIKYLDDETSSHGKDHFDGYDIPKGFLQPYAYAYAGINDLRKAIELISEAILRYHEKAIVTLDRAYFYSLNKQWKLVQLDAESVMNMEPGGADFGDLGKAFYYRGVSFENTGEKDKAIIDYKTSADYNNERSKEKLRNFSVSYSPKNPPYTLQGKWRNGILLSAVSLIMAFNALMFLVGPLMFFIMIGFVIFDIWFIKKWRKTRLKVYPRKKKMMVTIMLSVILFFGIVYSTTILGTLGKINAWEAEVAEALKDLAGKELTVETGTLNLRSAPNSTSNVIKILNEKDTVTATGNVSGLWVPVESGSDKGFVFALSTRFNGSPIIDAFPFEVTASAPIEVWDDYNQNYQQKQTLPRGKVIRVTSRRGVFRDGKSVLYLAIDFDDKKYYYILNEEAEKLVPKLNPDGSIVSKRVKEGEIATAKIVRDCNLYSDTNQKSAVIKELKVGDVITTTGNTTKTILNGMTWYEVTHNDTTGWIGNWSNFEK